MSMNLVPGVQRVTADAVIGQSGKPKRIFFIHLVSLAGASTCIIRNGTSAASTAFVQIDGIASQGVTLNFAGGFRFPDGAFFDADGNISYAVISYTEEF